MGSVLYDFLNESFLLQENFVEEQYASVTDAELQNELEKYREHAIGHLSDLLEESEGKTGTIRLFAGRDFRHLGDLKQAAFYLDAVILPDPLFPLTRRPSDVAATMNEYLGMPAAGELDRKGLAKAARLFVAVRPMVAANYVRFFPVSYVTEPPDEVPVRYSATQFAEDLPARILNKYQNAATVTSLRQSQGGWIIQDDLSLGRGIAIHFEPGSKSTPYIFNLFQQEVVKLDEEKQVAHFRITLPEEPPSKLEFTHWVNQSVNTAAREHFEQVQWDLALSTRCKAMYMTNSPLVGSLLDLEVGQTDSLKANTTKHVLNIDVPFINEASVEDLMYARADEPAFDLFRRELEKQFRELRLEKDPTKLQARIENAIHELTEVQLTHVTQKVERLRKKLAADGAIAMAGLAASVATSGASLLATFIATMEGYNSVAEFQKDARENPAYFLWKVKK